ncbi:MAG: hypothetical protein HWE13_01970 [Gammaproteobacteria bacterium]|nr:hypothetical protein [Gammaproteobacteria bacterium]
MKPIKIIPILLSLLIFGCLQVDEEALEDISYRQNNVALTLPYSWQITEDQSELDYRFLFIESAGDAVVRIEGFPQEDDFTLDDYIQLSTQLLAQESDELIKFSYDGNKQLIQENIGGQMQEGTEVKIQVAVVGMKVPHIQQYFQVDLNDFSYFILVQSEVSEYKSIKDDIKKILASFSVFSGPDIQELAE